MKTFLAFRIHSENGTIRAGIESITLEDLSPGEVVIRAAYSSINYKDALAGTGKGKILRRFPLVAGIDVSGTVAHSSDGRFQQGDRVLVTGCGLSEDRDGGYAEYVRVPADSVVPLPNGLSLYEAMVLGTAGFSAALALYRMETNGQRPEQGPVVVTGATGGVGSFAIDLLSGAGYEPIAVTGKPEAEPYLRALGAARVIVRQALDLGSRPLEKALWGGAIDNVGDEILAWLTRTVRPWGNIASIGLAGGIKLHTTVMPFILRGISLLGIHSVHCPYPIRIHVWDRLGTDLRPQHLDRIAADTVTLEQLLAVFKHIMDGKIQGRTVVRIAEDAPAMERNEPSDRH